MSDEFKYWAFISYSHQDKAWGDWLHKTLETYRVPRRLVGRASRDGVVPKRLYPIFRDREELPTSSDLGENINQALRQARYLVVICSPSAAVSRWVNEEVKAFKALGREDRILCLIVDGEPNASDKPGSGLLECFPEALRFEVDARGKLTAERTEPIAADARAGKDGKVNARLKILAGLLGVGFDELKQRERQRRFWRRLQIAGAALVLVAFFVGGWQWQVRQALIESYVEQGRQELLAGNRPAAAVYLSEAYLLGDNSSALRFMLARAALVLDARIAGIKHPGERLNTIVFDHAGSRFLTASEDGSVAIWSANTGERIVSAKDPATGIIVAVFTLDGRRFLTYSDERPIRVWDAATGRMLASLPEEGKRLLFRAASPDGRRIVTSNETTGAVQVWDGDTGKPRSTLALSAANMILATFSPDGGRLLTTAFKKTPVSYRDAFKNNVVSDMWDAESGARLFSLMAHEDKITSVRFSPDGQSFLTAGNDGYVRVWGARTGRLIRSLPQRARGAPVLHAEFASEGTVVVATDENGRVLFWDVADGLLLHALDVGKRHGTRVHAFLTPDGLRVVSKGMDDARIWDASTGELRASAASLTNEMSMAAVWVSPDGTRIVTSEGSDNLSLWAALGDMAVSLPDTVFRAVSRDLRFLVKSKPARVESLLKPEWSAALQLDGNEVLDGIFSRDGRKIATSRPGAGIEVWDLETGRRVTRAGTWAGYAAFSPDGALLVVARDDGTFEVRDAANGEPRLSVKAHSQPVVFVGFSADGSRIATASWDRSAKVWDRDGRLLVTLSGHAFTVNSASFSPDGKLIVTAGGDETARVWDAGSGRAIVSLLGHKGSVSFGRFSNDGRFVATVGKDRTIKVWSIPSGKLLASLNYYSEDGAYVMFNAGGDAIVLSSREGTLSVWDARLETRSPDGVRALVKCRVPWRLEAGKLVPATPDPSACPRSLSAPAR